MRLTPSHINFFPFENNKKLGSIKHFKQLHSFPLHKPRNTKGGSINIPMTSCLNGLD
jgi:hypothetical protein